MQGLSERTRQALAPTLAAVVAGLVCEAAPGAAASSASRPARDPWPRREHRPGAPLMDVFDERGLEAPTTSPKIGTNPYDPSRLCAGTWTVFRGPAGPRR